MKTVFVIMKWLLIVWGGMSLAGALVIGGFVAYRCGPGNCYKTNLATRRDVGFVLNRCNLGDYRLEVVVNSHVSARSFLGDHFDAYAIKITNVDMKELTTNTGNYRCLWYRGDQLPEILDEAVSFAGSLLKSNSISWFPEETELRSSEVYVYPASIYFHGASPSAAEIIFIRPKDKMVFYVSAAT